MGSTKISQPTPPPAPTTQETIDAWIKALPQIYDIQSQYAPKELQQQLDMLKEYMPQFTQQQYDINQQLYPHTSGLQEQLAQQASEGIGGGAPDWYQKQYADLFNSQLGTNVGSPIGADYYSRGMLEQQKNWGDYYRNLGLSMTNRMPLTTPSMGQTSNYMGGFTPGAVGSQMMQGYGSYSNLYGNMYAANAQNTGNPFMNLLSGIGGGIMGGFTAPGGKFNPFVMKQQ